MFTVHERRFLREAMPDAEAPEIFAIDNQHVVEALEALRTGAPFHQTLSLIGGSDQVAVLLAVAEENGLRVTTSFGTQVEVRIHCEGQQLTVLAPGVQPN